MSSSQVWLTIFYLVNKARLKIVGNSLMNKIVPSKMLKICVQPTENKFFNAIKKIIFCPGNKDLIIFDCDYQ